MRMSDFEECKNIRLFVKFTSEKYVDDLLSGSIYMNNIKYFIDLEKKYGNKGVGDRREAGFIIEPDKMYFLDPDTKQVLGRSVKAEVIKRYDKASEVPVFCYTQFVANDFVLIEDKDDYISFKLDIGEDKHNFLNFGDTAIILPMNFHDLLIGSAEKQDLIARVAGVEYQRFDEIDKEKEMLFDKGSVEMFYWKHEEFRHQREMRFVLSNTFVKDKFIFETENIKEQSTVVPIGDFLEGITIFANKIKD